MPSYSVSNSSVLALTMVGKHEGQQIMTVLHYRLSAGGIVSDGRAMLNAFLDKMEVDESPVFMWQNCLTNKVSAIRISGQWIAPARYGKIDRTWAPGDGQVAGASMPVNSSVAITRKTDFAGRKEVATIHMPGVPSAWVLDGAITVAGATTYGVFASRSLDVMTVTTAGGAEFYPIPFNRSNFTEAKQFTSYAIQPTVRVERRRTVGLGS